MSSEVWSAFTGIWVEAGKNNEYGEPNACGLGPFGLRHSSKTNSSTKHLRSRWRDPMIFVREASAAVVLVTLTLLLQCAGMAALTSLPCTYCRFCCGRDFIAGCVSHYGNLPFTSRPPVMRPSATAMSFFRGCGGPWVRWKVTSAC